MKSTQEKKIAKVKKQSASAVMDQKTSNSITLVNKQVSSRTNPKKELKTYHQEVYLDMYSFTMQPVSAEYKRKCALEWIEMTRDTEVLLMSEYFIQKGIPKSTWDEWVKKDPDLKEAQSIVRAMIAVRRERGGLKNQYSSNLVTRMQHRYDPDWKEAEEWRSSLSAKNEGNGNQPIQVILERYPDSPLVPPKKTEQ